MSIDDALSSITLYGLIWWNRFAKGVANTLDLTIEILTAVKGVFENEQYVYFEGHDVPVNIKGFNGSMTDCKNALVYDKATRTFGGPITNKAKKLPYLTAELTLDGKTVHNLSDWIVSICYRGTEQPNIRKILMAWSLETRTLLDISMPYVLEVINDCGEIEKIQVGRPVEQPESPKNLWVKTPRNFEMSDLAKGC